MNTIDLLSRWAVLSLEEIESEIEAGTNEDAMEHLFGSDEVAEVRSIMEISQARGLREAVVLLPGFMGSLLSSIRGVTTLMWINPLLFLKGQANLLELNHQGTQDANPGVDIVPIGSEKLAYLKMSLTLNRQLSRREPSRIWRSDPGRPDLNTPRSGPQRPNRRHR